MQTIIITGGAWFIGSHFLDIFVPKFREIRFINLDNITYAWDLSRISDRVQESENYLFEHVDIRNKEKIVNLYKKYTPTGTIHFAAETHVDRSIISPDIFLETNILGTKNLLDAHREYAKGRFHFVSTDEVYGDNPGNHLSKESDMLRPSSPYSASKAGAEMLVMSYGRTFGIDYTISRGSNTYGTSQYPEKLIPYSLKRIREGKSITIYGDGENVRDWLSVEDHITAIWEIFTRGKMGEIYNVGANNLLSNNEIIHILLEMLSQSSSSIEYIPDRLGHDRRYALDISKIEKELGWSPRSDFRESLKKILFHS